jgi:phosphoserine aminotransferase
VLSPRAVERLTSYTPPWPLPKIFRMTKGGKLIDGLFVGETLNTPSMLCVEDYLDALLWAKSVGGLKGLQARADANFKVLADWAGKTPWIDHFAVDPATRSNTSVCLKVIDPAVTALDLAGQEAFVRAIASRLDKEGVAHDIAYHRDAPPHFRIWAGATIEGSDLAALTGWIEWGFAQEKAALRQAA